MIEGGAALGAEALVAEGAAAIAGAEAAGGALVATAEAVTGVVKAHVGQLTDAVSSLGGGGKPKEIIVSESKAPEAVKHLDETGQLDQELTVDRDGTTASRRENMEGVETMDGMDRDESPPAVFKESKNTSVRHIPKGDNRGAGAQVGN